MKIHFIGIGGIGVSALAKYYHSKGAEITGSDLTNSEIIESLKKEGIKIVAGRHDPSLITKEIDRVIYSPAIPKSNPEIKKAQQLKLNLLDYPHALGELTRKHYTVAVAGTHGKSTITAIAGILLEKAGFDPTVIVGTKIKEFNNSNERTGNSQYLVVEACEHLGSFLHYSPQIIILSNIEKDHLDYYKNTNKLLAGFRSFIDKLPEKDGYLIANKDSAKVREIIRKDDNVHWFSLKDKEKKKIERILKLPGDFNVSNALAVLKLARILKIDDKTTFEALSQYQGSWRRFEIIEINKPKKFTLINDYAHHPTALEKTLKAIREKYPKRKIWCFFQPHQYQRSYYLFDRFVKAIKNAPVDKIFIDNIYEVAGRESEEIKEKVSSKKLVNAINKENVKYLPQEEIQNYLDNNLQREEVVVIMGAGNIYNIALKIINKKEK